MLTPAVDCLREAAAQAQFTSSSEREVQVGLVVHAELLLQLLQRPLHRPPACELRRLAVPHYVPDARARLRTPPQMAYERCLEVIGGTGSYGGSCWSGLL
eukprot:TRINITY_DN21938_c0_g1_i1.p2 TRINITY_DN21938_c0_g1~~TRINITY_DN21938_c0_g1_i1.p2  ORF type:complete len:100 (+),score=6.32 TRINITY_DN21938_c0_g1_i1:272-571(+)